MLELIGDILNWAAAGVFFPLFFLPLALLLGGGRNATIIWIVIVSAIIGAGLVFVWATPILRLTANRDQALIFAALFAISAVAVTISGGVAKTVARLSLVFEELARLAGRAVMWLLLVMALVQFGIVILRYVFGINYIYMQESITYMHGAVFLVAGGYALLTDDHVRVDIFYREASARTKALIDFLGSYFFLFPVCLLLLWAASPYVATSWAVGEGSNESSGIQALYLLKSLVPAFAILIAMSGFTLAARAGSTLGERR